MRQEYQKDKTCCFCGHRDIAPRQVPLVVRCLNRALLDAVKDGYRWFVCGGSPGFETLAAHTVLYWKQVYNSDLRLLLCLPGQPDGSPCQEEPSAQLAALADDREYLGEADGLQECSRRSIALSSRCIHYWDGIKSGDVFDQIRYAEQLGLDTVDNIFEAVQLTLYFQEQMTSTL